MNTRSRARRIGLVVAAVATVAVLSASLLVGCGGPKPTSTGLATARGVSTVATNSARASGASSCGASSSGAEAKTIRVPQDAKTITAALSLAKAGDLVLVGPGVYHETAEIKTPRVTLRGLDRNKVIIDGDVLRANGVVLTGAGDAVQNLTVRNVTLNGILVTGQVDANSDGIGKGSDGYSPQDPAKFPPVQGFWSIT